MATLMLSVLGAFAAFEYALLRERREGVPLAKRRQACWGRRKALSAQQVAGLKRRVAAGESKRLATSGSCAGQSSSICTRW